MGRSWAFFSRPFACSQWREMTMGKSKSVEAANQSSCIQGILYSSESVLLRLVICLTCSL